MQIQKAAATPSMLLIFSAHSGQFDLFGYPVQRGNANAWTMDILDLLLA